MKIRTDFVTNSSSSSFVTINVSSGTLETYLSQNRLSNLFYNLEYLNDEGEIIRAELEKSVAQSLIAILTKIKEELITGSFDEGFIGADEDAIKELIDFISKNREIIDAEADCNIELKYTDSEDGFAYVQSLECTDHQGRLVKWPCADGWNFQDGGGYEQIQDFSARMFNGEIQELNELGYEAIWDLVWDDDALTTAIEETGIVEEFEVAEPGTGAKADYDPPKKPKQIRMDAAPQTLKECEKYFKCEEYGGQLYIEEIKKNVLEAVIPGEVDGMPVVIDQGRCDRNNKIERIVFAEGFTEIKADCFNDCKNLKEVVFASTINKIGSGVFKNSPWRNELGELFVVNGILVSYSGTESELSIPDGVTRINDYAFNYNSDIKSVSIPDSVEYIGDSAFNGCRNLININLPDHDIEFGTNPFAGTAWAESQQDWVILNGVLLGVTDNYYYAHFRDTTELTLPEGVKAIGKNTHGFGIRQWENVKRIILPEGLEVIGEHAFMGYENLEEVHLPSTLTAIGNFAFYRCKSLSSINIPDGLKEIGDSAFSGYSAWNDTPATAPIVEEMILPASVEKIGRGAFNYCPNLILKLEAGSYAEQYAKENDLKFELV